ncbi:MAG: tetratricopeptide repeat protein [Alphaproteobacteria bacterium]|nr:tetratricopeptide repeat protein [Alphaproteobacteria bacterium]
MIHRDRQGARVRGAAFGLIALVLAMLAGFAPATAQKHSQKQLRGAVIDKQGHVSIGIPKRSLSSKTKSARKGKAGTVAKGKPKVIVPAAASNKVQPGSVDVTYEKHPGFERLIFKWSSVVDYRIVHQQTGARILFARQGYLDLPALRARLRGSGLSIEAVPGPNELAVRIRSGVKRAFLHYPEGNRIIVDVLRASGSVQTAAASRPETAPSGDAKKPPTTILPKEFGSTGKTEPSKDERLGPGGTVEFVIYPVVKPKASMVKALGIMTMRFAWPNEVTAAAFRRGRHIWLVFGARAQLDLTSIRTGLGNSVYTVVQIAHADATVIRIAAAANLSVVMTRQGKAWEVALKPGSGSPNSSILVVPQPFAPGGGRLVFKTVAAGAVIAIRDPEAGDRLYVIPVSEQGLGIDPARRFIEFRILRTIQGIAIEVLADGVSIAADKKGVAVTSRRGLHFSRRGLGAGSSKKGQAAGIGRIFDFAGWRGGPEKSFPDAFAELKQARQQAVAAADKNHRNDERMRLARFLFAHGQTPEVLAILNLVAASDLIEARRAGFLALRGVSRYLLGQTKSAGLDIFDRSLDAYPEIALWRGAVAARSRDWRAANRSFIRAEGLLRFYPKHLKIQLGILAAEAAIETGEIDRARQTLAMVGSAKPSHRDRQLIRYLRGRTLAAGGKQEQALELWKILAIDGEGQARVRAAISRYEALFAKGKLDTDKAIDDLDRLRFVWRGGVAEFGVNHLLGRIYLKAGKIGLALKTLARARKLNPDLARTRKVRALMQSAYIDFFVKGKGPKLPPIRALGLFHEYSSLIPSGPLGDTVITKLADRLVAVDLLEQAAQLLSQQVDRRLNGVNRARVGARLALLRLLDRNPKAALAALDVSAAKDMPDDLAKQRLRLRARSFGSLGQTNNAISILEADTSREADLLRADLYWRAKRWKEAAVVYTRIAVAIPKRKMKITDNQSRILIAWSVTLLLSGDTEGLKTLRFEYGKAMEKSAYRDAYRTISTEISEILPEYGQIVAKVAEVDQFQAFMADYRRRIAQGGLQAIN